MSADLTDIHDELRVVARDLLGSRRAVRDVRQSAMGVDWALLAESGWLGLEVPERLDGAGATFSEVAVILEEMGWAAALSPFFGTVVLGVGALSLLEPTTVRDELLSQVASGQVILSVALVSDHERAGVGKAPFQIEPFRHGFRVFGHAAFVPDTLEADWLFLLANEPGSDPVLVRVHRDSGVALAPQPVVDDTRRLASVDADGVEVNQASVWHFDRRPVQSVDRLFDRAVAAIACDSLGVSEAMLRATVAYARVRYQFGRPIGAFQAVKHTCADMFVRINVARELMCPLLHALTLDESDTAVSASMAKSYVCEVAVDIAGKALQLHGGMGYTWESGIHIYLKPRVSIVHCLAVPELTRSVLLAVTSECRASASELR